MEKNSEVIPYHLYLGCECLLGDPDWRRPEIHPNHLAPGIDLDLGRPVRTTLDAHLLSTYFHSKIKLILRKLDSMTEEEAIEMYQQLYPWTVDEPNKQAHANAIKNQLSEKGIYNEGYVSMMYYIEWFPYLLSKGFDLFNLIEKGLAIDSSSLYNRIK